MTAAERLGHDPTSELWGEHRSRYRFAAPFAAGRRVLDVASGAGFGISMLAAAGGRVIGLDYDRSALMSVHAHQPHAQLIHADAMHLPLADGSIELIVSFETLEHVPDAAAMVAEFRRVLVSGGRLVLSTPNRAFGPPRLHTGNPFHIREFTADELRELLRRWFSRVQLYGQRPSAAYRFVPFLMIERDLSLGALTWKLLARLPFRLKNLLAFTLTGRPFYPSETDYDFIADRVAAAHALLAVAVAE